MNQTSRILSDLGAPSGSQPALSLLHAGGNENGLKPDTQAAVSPRRVFPDPVRFRLLEIAFTNLLPLKITRCPPARDGSQKTASVDFATAVWCNRFVRTLERVWHENEQADELVSKVATAFDGTEERTDPDAPF